MIETSKNLITTAFNTSERQYVNSRPPNNESVAFWKQKETDPNHDKAMEPVNLQSNLFMVFRTSDSQVASYKESAFGKKPSEYLHSVYSYLSEVQHTQIAITDISLKEIPTIRRTSLVAGLDIFDIYMHRIKTLWEHLKYVIEDFHKRSNGTSASRHVYMQVLSDLFLDAYIGASENNFYQQIRFGNIDITNYRALASPAEWVSIAKLVFKPLTKFVGVSNSVVFSKFVQDFRQSFSSSNYSPTMNNNSIQLSGQLSSCLNNFYNQHICFPEIAANATMYAMVKFYSSLNPIERPQLGQRALLILFNRIGFSVSQDISANVKKSYNLWNRMWANAVVFPTTSSGFSGSENDGILRFTDVNGEFDHSRSYAQISYAPSQLWNIVSDSEPWNQAVSIVYELMSQFGLAGTAEDMAKQNQSVFGSFSVIDATYTMMNLITQINLLSGLAEGLIGAIMAPVIKAVDQIKKVHHREDVEVLESDDHYMAEPEKNLRFPSSLAVNSKEIFAGVLVTVRKFLSNPDPFSGKKWGNGEYTKTSVSPINGAHFNISTSKNHPSEDLWYIFDSILKMNLGTLIQFGSARDPKDPFKYLTGTPDKTIPSIVPAAMDCLIGGVLPFWFRLKSIFGSYSQEMQEHLESVLEDTNEMYNKSAHLTVSITALKFFVHCADLIDGDPLCDFLTGIDQNAFHQSWLTNSQAMVALKGACAVYSPSESQYGEKIFNDVTSLPTFENNTKLAGSVCDALLTLKIHNFENASETIGSCDFQNSSFIDAFRKSYANQNLTQAEPHIVSSIN